MTATTAMFLLIPAALLIVITPILATRTIAVLNFRIKVIEAMGRLADKEIKQGVFDVWENRYATFKRAASYNRMTFMFWRPLTVKEWYKNTELNNLELL